MELNHPNFMVNSRKLPPPAALLAETIALLVLRIVVMFFKNLK